MEGILNSSPFGIWVWDGFGRVIAVNRMAEKFGGVREKSLIGTCYLELIRQGLYDHSVVGDIFKHKKNAVVRARSLRTGTETLNAGTPNVDDRGEVYRIVVQETLTGHIGMNDVIHRSEQIEKELGLEFSDPYRVQVGPFDVIAQSPSYRNTLKTSFILAEKGVSRILILGESGSGKGFLVKLIHEKSPRRKQPFVQINCAAVPENLLEAELFGYESGAFTGANPQGKEGLLEQASGGTLFLDEIGEMPLSLQAKLLKYLDDFEVTRLGGVRPHRVDCTLVCATNANLKEKVKQGTFREDLYYRINAFSLNIPPLRQRREDILGLLSHYVDKYNKRFCMERYLSCELLDQLQNYPFPGNVRELKNMAMRIVVLDESHPFDSEAPPTQQVTQGHAVGLKDRISEFERELLMKTMMVCPTTRDMANHLSIDQSSVVRKLKKYGLTLHKSA